MAVWWMAAPDIGPAHHTSTCSTFLSFPFLLFPFVSFISTREVADMAVWWTAAPDIGPVHHASTCSTFLSFPFLSFPFLSFPFLSFPFLSFPLRALVKWPIWPCGGRQHWILVLRITLQPALFSFALLCFPLRAFAKWPTWLCGGWQYRISVLHITLQPALLSFPFLYEHSRSGQFGLVVDGSTRFWSCTSIQFSVCPLWHVLYCLSFATSL